MQPSFNIALQLWTVRERAERDMIATLGAVAHIGYTAVEFASLNGAAPSDLRHALDKHGLKALSAHIPLADLRTRLPQIIDEAQLLGLQQIVLPWIPAEQRASLEQVARLAEACNQIGRTLRDAGIRFAYHNEDYDFQPLGATTLWQALVEATDPAVVEIQLDICTAISMHADLPGMLRTYGQRITTLHICDLRASAYVPIGAGTLDWPTLLAAASQTAACWLIVEQDAPPDPLNDAATSLQALQDLLWP